MSNLKERWSDRELTSVDDIALKEVEGYIEKIEKTTEVTVSDQNSQTQVVVNQSPVITQTQLRTTNNAEEKKQIVLPISERKLVEGLKESPNLGLRWLAEWCLLMIKKYPTRVFYSPVEHD